MPASLTGQGSAPARSAGRSLGLLTAVAMVVANMIGTGVFTTSGFLLADLKTPERVLFVWILGGVVALLGALCYGALSRRIPESGGEYLFLSRTLHPSLGYVAGWISLLVGFSAPLAAAAFAFGQYALPWTGSVSPQATGSVLLIVFCLLHSFNVQRGAWVQNVTVIVKVVLIAGFIVFGATRLPDLPAAEAASVPAATVAVSLVWVMFSYSGWNAAIYIGGEVRDPEVNLPRALWIGTLLVMVLYVTLNAVFVFSTPYAQLAGKLEVGRIAAEAIGGVNWGIAVTLIVALALITSVSSMMMAGPRVYAQMAADGYLPKALAVTAGEAPRNGMLLQLALSLLLLWSTTYEGLLTYIGFTLGLSTALTVAGLMRLRWREGQALKVPGWPWIPLLFLAAILAITVLTIQMRPAASLYGMATLLLGWIMWRAQTLAFSRAGQRH
jgi:basic amino acid/polyamine antiporter, APA family